MSSAGQEAIELSASAGLILDPWQQQILIDALGERADGKWSAFEVALIVGRQNGKGSILEARELAGLFLFGEQLILHSAHEFKTAAEAFRRVLSLIENTDDLRKRVKKVQVGHGDEGVELRSGARLRFVARSTGSGRGFSGDLVILDEAYALTATQIEALLPTMSARPNPQIWYTSSPCLDGEAELLRVKQRGEVGDPRLAYFDYGAPGDLDSLADVDLDDRGLWRATNPAYGIRISEEFIERERAALSDQGFARERLCIWPRPTSSADNVIDPAAWAALTDARSAAGQDLALCVDVTPKRDHASIGVYSPRPDGLGHIELIDYRAGVRWLVPALVKLRDLWNPVAIALDANGPALALLDDLADVGIIPPEDPERPERGQLAIPTAAERASAYGQMIDAVIEGDVRHRNQPLLNLAVGGAKTRTVGDLETWTRRKATVDICPLVAVTLARWAYLMRAPLVLAADYDPLASIF